MQTDYIEKFVNICISNGKNNPVHIREAGEEEMIRLNAEMRTYVKETSEKIGALRDMVRQMGGKLSGKKDIFNYYAYWETLRPEHKTMIASIISLYQKKDAWLTSEILDALGYQDNKIILESIYWLNYKRVIARNKTTRAFEKGETWFKVPELTNLNRLIESSQVLPV